ncbi:hypothetical protein [Acetobacter nitrogenifigens]|uniref:Uncharacterized protein n=1 Tax=Acetobacter nitrogenifigens DSM 23921 = NBRC 105050 TaxID=1120919 RepID=A0A511XCL8_9PROT|nr:hypothetical protein [Acetobacter nitrogenifigens]GEN60713.1 hypothetical protein ANI02nite_25970 [Acetobacter nitrogenifigens DSM 23921 = NBRC 105050]
MQTSTIVEVDGVFVGAAVRRFDAEAPRFYATHDSVRALHDEISPDIATLTARVAHQFRRARSLGYGSVGRN